MLPFTPKTPKSKVTDNTEKVTPKPAEKRPRENDLTPSPSSAHLAKEQKLSCGDSDNSFISANSEDLDQSGEPLIDFESLRMSVYNEDALLAKIKGMVDPITTQLQEIKGICNASTESLKKELDNLKREKSLIIRGLPEEANENAEKRMQIVQDLFTNKMKVSGVLIDDVYRVGRKDKAAAGGFSRFMIVKLVCGIDMQRILGGKKLLRGNIFVNKDQSKEDRERDKAFRDFFKTLKTSDKDITKSVDFKGRLKIWKNNAVTHTYCYDMDKKQVKFA